MCLSMALSLALACGAAQAHALPALAITAPTPNSRIIVHRGIARSGTLRGDWEPPRTLVAAYYPAWSEPLASLIEAALPEVAVCLLISAPQQPADVQAWLGGRGVPWASVGLLQAALDSPWIRDYGPLQRSGPGGANAMWLDTQYNATRPNDDALPRQLASAFAVPLESVPVVLDGGALSGNGAGLCAMTWSTFQVAGLRLTDAVGLDRFLLRVGCDALAVLPGLTMERTGHVDMLAQFVSRTGVMVAELAAAAQPDDAANLQEAVIALQAAGKALGTELVVHRIPTPAPEGSIYRSYVNGTRLVRQFLVPSYEGATLADEARAYEALRRAMPGTTLVPIGADAMIASGGAVHCMSLGLSVARSSAK